MRFSRKQVLATVALIVCAAALVVAAVKWGPEAFAFFADGDPPKHGLNPKARLPRWPWWVL